MLPTTTAKLGAAEAAERGGFRFKAELGPEFGAGVPAAFANVAAAVERAVVAAMPAVEPAVPSTVSADVVCI